MVCPKCLHAKTQVYNSRATARANQIWRRRRCTHCGFVFSTREYIEADQLLRLELPNGKSEPFSRVRLLLAIARCLGSAYSPDVAMQLTTTIEQKLLHASSNGTISPPLITATCLGTLRAFDTKTYVAYLATAPITDERELKKLLRKKR